MTHMCEYLSEFKNRETPIFERIFEENISEQKEIYKIFEENYIDRIQTNVIFCKDPLSCTGTAMDK